ncbi:hypothetical protein ACJX0J_025934 [Zea mays]
MENCIFHCPEKFVEWINIVQQFLIILPDVSCIYQRAGVGDIFYTKVLATLSIFYGFPNWSLTLIIKEQEAKIKDLESGIKAQEAKRIAGRVIHKKY